METKLVKSQKKAANVAVEITLSESEKAELASFANSRTLPHALVQRARIILAADRGQTNIEIAQEVQLSRENVGKWRKRYAKYGLPGIYDQLRTGRPRMIDEEQIAKVISDTINRKPKEETHWSTRSLAEQTGLSKSTI